MNREHFRGDHASEAELVRLLDDEESDLERRRLTAHLHGCAACSGRLNTLAAHDRAATEYLERLEVQPADELTRARALAAARSAHARPVARAAAPWLRAAAAAGVVIVAGATVSPVRAWVAERWSDLLGDQALVPAETATSTAVLDRGSTVSFVPAGTLFVLEVAHAQEIGEVQLEIRDVRMASARVEQGREETILVLPSGVKIENSEGSTASYSVTLPAGIERVQVFSGGRPVAIVDVDEAELPWSRTVSLDRDGTS